MNWYFDSNGQQTGPVEAGDVLRRLQTGDINPGTLVWREGLPAWVPLRQVLPELQGGLITEQPLDLCDECGYSFPPADLDSCGAHRLCRTCKPAFIERAHASLSAETRSLPSLRVWRQNKLVIMAQDGELPCRCFKCNDPAEPVRLPRTLYWHPPWLYLIVIFNLLIYAIIAMCVRKTQKIGLPLCARHKAVRNRDLFIAWGGIALSILIPVLMAFTLKDSTFTGAIIVCCAALLLFCVLYGVIRCRQVTASLITDTHLHLSGSGPAFRASLGEWNGY